MVDGGDGRLDIYLTWTPPGSGGGNDSLPARMR